MCCFDILESVENSVLQLPLTGEPALFGEPFVTPVGHEQLHIYSPLDRSVDNRPYYSLGSSLEVSKAIINTN